MPNIFSSFLVVTMALFACTPGETKSFEPSARSQKLVRPPTPLSPPTPDRDTGGQQAMGDSASEAEATNAQTDGDGLVGDYVCRFDAQSLPIGPFKLSPFGCRIFRDGDGTLKLGKTSGGIASLRGEIKNPTQSGFSMGGLFRCPGNRLTVRVNMRLRPGREIVYVGKGLGALGDNKERNKEFSLVMRRN